MQNVSYASGIELEKSNSIHHYHLTSTLKTMNTVTRCSKNINQPAHKSSCGNLLSHVTWWSKKANNPSEHRTLALVGISGTGDIDPGVVWAFAFLDIYEFSTDTFAQVLKQCVVWCAEAAKPFLALQETCMKRLLHPTILKHLPSREMISKGIHMLTYVFRRSYESDWILPG
jgi:hypothetical protein